MKKIRKIAKIWATYALITGYCCYLTDQLVMIWDPKNGVNSGKLSYEFPWKHVFDNLKTLFDQ